MQFVSHSCKYLVVDTIHMLQSFWNFDNDKRLHSFITSDLFNLSSEHRVYIKFG